jgi:PAS domain S-box-containing protein
MNPAKTKIITRLIEIGCAPEDSEELRLKKSLMTIMVLPYSLAAIIWGVFFMVDESLILGIVPFFYASVSLVSFIYFAVSKRYKTFRLLQLIMVLIMPMLVQFTLGGFFSSGGMVTWSCTAPFVAIVFYDLKEARKWLFATAAVVCIATIMDDYAKSHFLGTLDEGSAVVVFCANFILASSLVFLILNHFAIGNKKIKAKLEEKDELIQAYVEIAKQKELLSASKKRLELVMESLEEVVWGLRLPDHKMQYVSDSVVNLYGLPKNDWFENSNLWFEMIHPDDKNRVKELIQTLHKTGSNIQEYRIITKDKEIKWIKSKVRILKDKDGAPFLMTGITIDITDQKNAEKDLFELNNSLEEKVKVRTLELTSSKAELAKALAKEKELGRLKSSFVTVASHQFRTPMAIIQSNTELLRLIASASNLSETDKFDNVSGRITEAISSMTTLMNDVLELSKLEAGKSLYLPKDVDLIELCKDLADKFNENQPEDQKIEFSVSGDSYNLQLDPSLLSQSLSNLLSNAIKYSTGKRGPKLLVDFNPEEVELSVKDYGIGISEEEYPYLFEPFFRANNATDINGTGLGLSIAKEYVLQNKGDISAESVLGEGSCFKISFNKVLEN